MSSPFLERPESDWIASNALAFAIFDGFPVSPGHALIIPKRLVATWFDASAEEQQALMALVETVKARLDAEYQPDGYNVGINVGEAGGQTVFHLHVHLIPRYHGDMDDPRGGVRHVIPWKGNYKRAPVTRLATGGDDPFQNHLLPLFHDADDIAIVAAFVQDTGLLQLQRPIREASARGARVRLLTGDYLDLTAPDALRRLLGWLGPNLEARVFEVRDGVSFHPKAWRFERAGRGVAFVGSSNLSAMALGRGIEWNLRLDRDEDRPGWQRLVAGFEALWTDATPLTADWVERYARRERPTRPTAQALDEHGDAEEPEEDAQPAPHAIQREALDALAAARAERRGRALVVLATGLGKTWLAAFDVVAAFRDAPAPPKVLFIAHREEILDQAAVTLGAALMRRWPRATVDFCVGAAGELGADLVVASVQKLSREPWLERAASYRWDYVIVDEVHHATAPSYRRVLDALDAAFVLGLTATPGRDDEADLLGLFDDHLAFRADLDRGIESGLLVPFRYFGLRDTTDYAHIPWRNRRFDPAALAEAVQTQARMERLWEAWQSHPGHRTLVFCASLAHANFVRDWLSSKGVRVAAVHSGEGSDDRSLALARLRAGELDAVAAVDMFNEGVDLPAVDRVAMLRPTESSVLFLQQLGRGLRLAPGKDAVTVIDFVGNHKVFLERMRMLVSLGARQPGTDALAALLETGQTTLPAGCSVDVELEAIDLLRHIRRSGRSELERAYRELRDLRDDRPTVGDLYRLGLEPGRLRGPGRGWFDFVRSEGDLTPDELAVLDACGEWLRELETSAMTKSFKAVVLHVLLEQDALHEGMSLTRIAGRSYRYLLRSPELMTDLDGVFPAPREVSPEKWRTYWRGNPIAAWTRGRFFEIAEVDGEPHLKPRFAAPEGLAQVLAALTRELVDVRLAQYRDRLKRAGGAQVGEVVREAFTAVPGWTGRDPYLVLGDTARTYRHIIVAEVDGAPWEFSVAGGTCKEALPQGTRPRRNRLPDLLRRWFGPDAGQPGRGNGASVTFTPTGGDDGMWHIAISPSAADMPHASSADAESSTGHVIIGPWTRVRAYPTLRAAAGALGDGISHEIVEAGARLVLADGARWATDPDIFLVRVDGDSMDGGAAPIRDGAWIALRHARGVGLAAIEGKVALVQVGDDTGGFAWQLKRVVRDGRGWRLRSDNPERPSFTATADTVVIATLVAVLDDDAVRDAEAPVEVD